MQNFGSTHRQVIPAFKKELGINSAYDNLKGAIVTWHSPTAEHSIRVRIQATYLGMALGMGGRDLTNLSYGAELHDIGKLRIPQKILDKTEKLTATDLASIECHPTWGIDIVTAASIGNPDVKACILQHHELEDGSGYPNGLTGLYINPLAKIVAVADAFVALMEDRPYGGRMTDAEALMVLLDDDRGRYDTNVVRMLAHLVMHSKISSGD